MQESDGSAHAPPQPLKLPSLDSDDEQEDREQKEEEETAPSTQQQLFKRKTYAYHTQDPDSDDEMASLTEKLHAAADAVKKTHERREEMRIAREMDADRETLAFSSMEDVHRQQLATVCLERTAVAVSGDAVLQLPESVFHRWAKDAEKRPAEDQAEA
jgi:hypothetical protein